MSFLRCRRSLADNRLVCRFHDAEFEQQVFEFFHRDRRRDRALAGIRVDLLGQLAILFRLLEAGSYSSTVMRRSSACCTTLSRGMK